MNISQPISSEVESVEFTFLSPAEIEAVSVKRIENESTFDSMLNPVPGGLYDPALGSWGDSPCTTCNLNHLYCPGHPGHIKLPVPVYHPIFLDQAYHLLRATCLYCKGFRLSAKDLHKYMCKLRLLQHGLVHEAHIVGAIGETDFSGALEASVSLELDGSEAEDDTSSIDNVTRKREKYVQLCLQRGRKTRRDIKKGKHEGTGQMRREVIKEFLAELTKRRECVSCNGISPTYRKDSFVKIFEKALSDKDTAKMAQRNLKFGDAMSRVYQKTMTKKDQQNETTHDSSEDESQSGEDVTMQDADEEESTIPKANRPAVNQRYISPMEVRARLVELFDKEQDLVSLLYNATPATKRTAKTTPHMFFVTVLLVPPNRFRPEARTGDSQISEASQNNLYKNILRSNGKIAKLHDNVKNGSSDITALHLAWVELQESVNALVDKNKNPVQGAAAKRNEDGIKQKLEKKEGLFRKNMMGKRVNYAARSVISPDPNIDTNEIGVPPVFAQKLTYPEPVTSHNFRDMQQAVINGVSKWPGAIAIEDENGQIVNLRNKSVDDRISLANQLLAPTNASTPKTKNKKVHRHMTNGDVVLMNRQPTLHKPSIMGHRVRVLPGEKTIRMHYANCNTYNADFDGDEMNMHFPQNEVARAEALQIADTDHQYLSGTQGKPLRGLIQDHLSVSIVLCNRDTFFTKGDYHSLIYSALRPESGHILSERLQLVPPAIIKPVPRWTGKQIITTILKNLKPATCGGLTMHGDTQLKAEQWGPNSEEGVVRVQDGELITGILDKSQIGQSSGGLVHAAHEVYGSAIASKLLSCLGRLLTRLLNMQAFSCGMDDLRLTEVGEKARLEALEQAGVMGLKIASEYVSLPGNTNPTNNLLLERLEEVLREDKKQEGLDLLMNQGTRHITDGVQKACLPNGLEKPFPKNQMQAMTTSGAKGSRVNASLISCNLGQQVLEGRRVPLMVSGKTLPCFKPFETHIRSAGYIRSRFLTGIRPHEYYFHHMAGREGLIDTAVKTSRSGYLQRCVIKGLEGLVVSYDASVRDADGSVIQFLYGEDGLDVTKQKYLSNFDFILENVASQVVQLKYDTKGVETLTANRDDFMKYMKKAVKHAKSKGSASKDPLIGLYNPTTNTFAMSELFYEAMSTYVKENKSGLIRDKSSQKKTQNSVALSRKNAEALFALKYQRSLVEPGEAVGIVAGQSVGEPSTQMTLNTFHLAGHAATNVTQGIPRLREILMTASAIIATPSMTLYPQSNISPEQAEIFTKKISRTPLGYIVDSITVEEQVGRGQIYSQAKVYKIKLKFFPSDEYCQTYAITVADVMNSIEKKLMRQIIALMKKEIKKRSGQSTGATPEIGVRSGVVEVASAETNAESRNDDDNDDDDGDDGDATSAKQRANRGEEVSYGDNDDEDNAIQKAMGQDAADESEDEQINGASNGAPTGDDSEDESDEEENQAATTARAEGIKTSFKEVSDFECDEKDGAWCNITIELEPDSPKLLMLNLVKTAISKSMIREIRGVGTCTFVSGAIEASGVNLHAMQTFAEYIDPDKIKTNDIASVLSMYGVEACRASIVRELGNVFGGHGISVDNRHLNLIADYMTRNGAFTAFSRMGLKGNVSPFTKMSFETTLAFLKDAVLDGDWDDLTTPSGRLVLGRLGKLGTGFTKTGYGAQGGDDSGGFMADGSQQGSQSGGKAYQDDSLRPVTVRQIIEAEEGYSGGDFKIDGASAPQVTFVGQIRSVNAQATNITLKIDDGTGQIEVKKWIDGDKPEDPEAYELDSYVRVWGRLKSFSNKRHVGAHVIRPVTDFNEVNYHMLEATYVHLHFTRGPLGGGGGGAQQQQNGGATNGDSMFVDGGAGYDGGASQNVSKLARCTPGAKKMFNFLSAAPGSNEGVDINIVTSSTGMSTRDVLTAADELLGQGLIYTTLNDETWAILEY
ncbi:DNA-directed RNA polymerase I subunit RPA1 [Cordyceps militaris CM01]|uniref:DNA-directed RNA polymerase subunit n=1 Tax=Cordyceps militaris (strain CM01) TaxID=983644 RepID=G3JDM8_CORMM|nr:DNA-directed RNA polymerase I subunit RPA1 [Cordyceps militaris CM01]EGX92703.1 DNA-directed RNA polymerase I subunit RPA1 [Cordyceps militaris CM01]